MARLSDEEITERLEGSEWSREGDRIVRDIELDDFKGAIGFVNRVADAAEATDHHPDILVHDWNNVRLSFTNHSEGGLTAADFDMAARVDGLL
jgi:4a-hydroxytetrahydrobiopterin dehydratase